MQFEPSYYLLPNTIQKDLKFPLILQDHQCDFLTRNPSLMASHYIHSSSDAILHTSMLSARSSVTSTNNTVLSNAEKVTLYVVAATAGVLIVLGIAIAVLRTRCPNGPWAATGNLRQRSMPKKLLKTLPLVQYDDGNDAVSCQAVDEKADSASVSGKTTRICKSADSTCAICTDDFVKGHLVRIMPCGHLFHQACVDEWLVERSRTCPSW